MKKPKSITVLVKLNDNVYTTSARTRDGTNTNDERNTNTPGVKYRSSLLVTPSGVYSHIFTITWMLVFSLPPISMSIVKHVFLFNSFVCLTLLFLCQCVINLLFLFCFCFKSFYFKSFVFKIVFTFKIVSDVFVFKNCFCLLLKLFLFLKTFLSLK